MVPVVDKCDAVWVHAVFDQGFFQLVIDVVAAVFFRCGLVQEHDLQPTGLRADGPTRIAVAVVAGVGPNINDTVRRGLHARGVAVVVEVDKPRIKGDFPAVA